MVLTQLHQHKLKLEAVSSVNTPATTGVVTVAFDLIWEKYNCCKNISAAITLGTTKATSDVETLRDAVNAYTAQTGIEVLSQDKSNLILTNAEGYDIKIIDVNFDLETVNDTNLSTTTDADSTDTTTLNVSFYYWS